MSTSSTVVATGFDASQAKSTSTTTRAEMKARRVPSIERSASLPPIQLPTTSPAPNSTRSHGTALGANPLTSVRVYAM